MLQSHEEERKREEILAVENIKENSKYFFSYANKKSRNMSPVGPLEDNDQLECEPEKIAQILKQQYENVFSVPRLDKTVDDPITFFQLSTNPTVPLLIDIKPELEEIVSAINAIDQDSTPGVRAKILKNCKNELALPLKLLASKSLSTGVVSSPLKEGIVTPIYKGGNKGLAKNYRPVTLTSHIGKIIERVVRERMTTYVDKIWVFNNEQHGFRKNRSCLSHQEALLQDISKGKNVDVIYLDFAKVFD